MGVFSGLSYADGTAGRSLAFHRNPGFWMKAHEAALAFGRKIAKAAGMSLKELEASLLRYGRDTNKFLTGNKPRKPLKREMETSIRQAEGWRRRYEETFEQGGNPQYRSGIDGGDATM